MDKPQSEISSVFLLPIRSLTDPKYKQPIIIIQTQTYSIVELHSNH